MRSVKRALALGMAAATVVGLSACQPDGQSGCRPDDRNRSGSDGRSGRGDDLQVVGLTSDQRLLCFEEDDPDDARTIGRVTGLTGDTRLVGIDYRPATGALYGLGNAGGVYTVNDSTAAATKRSQVGTALSGTNFGVDFNPVVDRLRIISDTAQNLRVDVDSGVTNVDGPLTYPATPTTPATTATGVTGAGYTNNDSDANTATTLYDIDSVLDQVVVQSPANSGMLAATGKLTVDASSQVGFDVYSTVRNGSTVDVQALAALQVGGRSRLYGVTLFTGKAQGQGAFSSSNQVIGLAIPLNQL